MSKKQLGQFFTVNSDYILSGLSGLVKGKNVVDPFAGSGDLMSWAKKHGARRVVGFDVDKKYANGRGIRLNDSLKNPKKYSFVLTNPPYLNVNKADVVTKEKYFIGSGYEDLYQISLSAVLNSDEGIIIVPVNFLSAENSKKIRKIFFSTHKITRANYFRQQVFPDTTYNVIAFHFQRLTRPTDSQSIKFVIYPEEKERTLNLREKEGWAIGAEVLRAGKTPNIASIYRLTEECVSKSKGNKKVIGVIGHVGEAKQEFMVSDSLHNLISKNIILLRAIDSGSPSGRIDLSDIRDYGIDCLVSKPTSRHMIHLIFPRPISISAQKKLINEFNKDLNLWRDKYDSLFLTNYRDNDRKRIGFDFVYGYLNHLLPKINQGQGILV